MLAEARGKTYRPMPSPYGPGLLLDGISQIDEVVARFPNGLADLRIVAGRKPEPLDLSRLAPLQALRSLSPSSAQRFTQAPQIERRENLVKLEVEEQPDQTTDLGKLGKLRWLNFGASSHWRNVAQLGHLEFLQVSAFRDADFGSFGVPQGVKRLELYGSSTLQSCDGISVLEHLRYLGLFGLQKLRTLDSVGPLEGLSHLIVEDARSLVNIDAVAALPKLAFLEIRNCPNLRDAAAFPATSALTHVFFTGSTRLTQPAAPLLGRLPHLKYWSAAE